MANITLVPIGEVTEDNVRRTCVEALLDVLSKTTSGLVSASLDVGENGSTHTGEILVLDDTPFIVNVSVEILD